MEIGCPKVESSANLKAQRIKRRYARKRQFFWGPSWRLFASCDERMLLSLKSFGSKGIYKWKSKYLPYSYVMKGKDLLSHLHRLQADDSPILEPMGRTKI